MGLGEYFLLGFAAICESLHTSLAPRQAAGPGSCLKQGQHLPANTDNMQASETWRMSTYCEKPRSLLFPHLPSSPFQNQACCTRIANAGGDKCVGAPLLSSGGAAGRDGVHALHIMLGRDQPCGMGKHLPWLSPKAKGYHPAIASLGFPSHRHKLDPSASPGPPCVIREAEGTHTHICPSGA